VPVFGRDFYAPANRVATFIIDIFYAKSAVTIFFGELGNMLSLALTTK
jgi:hypothetical protein